MDDARSVSCMRESTRDGLGSVSPESDGRISRELPVLVVAGLGRCGTSLALQMLHAAGIPCAGEWPAFEPPDVLPRVIDPAWWAAQRGRAVKVLDPHRRRLPASAPAVVVWMERDLREQARSIGKMAFGMAGRGQAPTRAEVRGLEAGLRRDAPAALRALGPAVLLRLCFEDAIRYPDLAAKLLAVKLAPWWPALDTGAMADVVRQRPPECLAGLLELSLVAGRDGMMTT